MLYRPRRTSLAESIFSTRALERFRRRIFLPEPFAMLSTDTDGQHGSFLTIDENGQATLRSDFLRPHRVATRQRPLGIGSLFPANGPVAGAQVSRSVAALSNGTRVTLGAKAVSVTFQRHKHANLSQTPSLAAGAQQLVVTNPYGESVTSTPPSPPIGSAFPLPIKLARF